MKLDPLEMLVDFYVNEKFARQMNKNNKIIQFTPDEDMDILLSHTYTGMTYLTKFLNEPINYLYEYNCSIYYPLFFSKPESGIAYYIVNKIKEDPYNIMMIISFDKKTLNYIVDKDESIDEQIIGMKETIIADFETKIKENIEFFTNSLKKLDEYTKKSIEKYSKLNDISERYDFLLINNNKNI